VNRLLDRVGPVLDSRRIAVPPVRDPGHVASRIHVRCGFARAVTDDAVVEREAAATQIADNYLRFIKVYDDAEQSARV